MEDSGLAFAAPASYLPDGLAMKDNSNHLAMQQMDLPDTANIFATPVRNTVGHGAGTGAQEQAGSGSHSLNIASDGDGVRQSEGGQMNAPAANETCVASASKTVDSKLERSQLDYSTLDTPARPTVDHGIESGVRDTLDMSLPDCGVFKVESVPPGNPANLELYESQDGPPTNGELPETESMADPSTPSVAQGAFTASPTIAEEEPSVHQAYAMLKFPDSYYYVKSTNVMITRDETFYRVYRESKRQKRLRAKMQRAAQQTLDDYAREPSHHSQHGGDDEDDEDLMGRPAHGLLSAYSDAGGPVSYVVKPDNDFVSFDSPPLVHRARKSKHNSSSNHSIAPRSLHEFEQGAELEGDLYLDKEGRLHDPHEWAQVAIHPQDPKDIEKISREHLIIRYDADKRSWVMDVIGNRVLHNGELRNRGESDIDLSHDDEIIIISVSFRFMLPADEGIDVMESVECDDDEFETSLAARRISDTIDDIESDEDADSSEEDVPLAQQTKPKKLKVKVPKNKEPKPKPLKLKLKNKQASKNAEVKIADTHGKKDKVTGKTPAKAGGKTGGKTPAKATKAVAKAEPTPDARPPPTEAEASKPTTKAADEQQSAPSTEAQLVEFAQAPPAGPPTQASPPAPINLDPNSAFAGADPSQLPQKRKGPGRPPKNGLISKRDDAGVKRKIKEYERQNLPPPPMNELLEMVRVEQRQKDAAAKAASRGEATPDMVIQNMDPRMPNYSVPYASAAPSQPAQSLPAGTNSPHDLPQSAARSTSPRPRRPAKSPSPMPAQESFTEEQLKKPTITYVFIIDEILQDPALDGQADLQTIYDKIQKRWPYFKYGTSTNGWQSSVRHNLLQCQRFVESGKSGKGKYWKINFEHELDPKKRKQATPPPQHPPQSGSGGPPYSQPYNVPYQQANNMYSSPYNPGAYPGAGPAGGAQAPPSGPPASGPYPQQTHYGSQPPNGNRMPPQQPPAPQPFATIVQAIVAYKPQFLQPHVGKDTHARAEEQFNQALNHYSELHAGNTPTTEGQIDESQDPFRTMKQIFIQYGQGDTRGTQSNAPTPAPNAAPTANAVPAAPGKVTSHAPAAVMGGSGAPAIAGTTTTPVPQVHPTQNMTSSQPLTAAPGVNSSTAMPFSQQMQPPAMSGIQPKPPTSGPGPSNIQPTATRPVSTASMQNASIIPVAGAATQSQPQTAPTPMQVAPPRPLATGSQTGTSSAAGGAPRFQPSAAPSISSSQNGQQQTNRVASPSSASLPRPPPVQRPQQTTNAGISPPPVVPAHQPGPTIQAHAPAPQARAQPGPLQRPTPNVVGGATKPQQHVSSPSGPAPLAQLSSPVPPQQCKPDQKLAQTGSNVISPALPRVNGFQAQSMDRNDANQGALTDVRPPPAGVKRVADHSDEDQAAKRPKILSANQAPDTNSALETTPCEKSPSAGAKRTADESMDSEAKRLKTTQESAATPAAS